MANCLSMQVFKNKKTGVENIAACGKCPHCHQNKIDEWTFRMEQSLKTAISSLFVTLTYNTDHVPISRNGFMTLNTSDMTKFMKRLRYYHDLRYKTEYNKNSRPPIVYLYAGEYGSTRERLGYGRPHYHMSILNADPDLIDKAWRDPDGNPIGNIDYGDEKKGVTAQSVAYSIAYVFDNSWHRKHSKDDRINPFRRMSKGIGLNYLTPAMVKWHRKDLLGRMYLPLMDGRKMRMPAYYRDKIYNEDEQKLICWHMVKEAKADIERKRQENPDYDREQDQAKLQAYKRAANKAKHNKA